MLLLCALIVGSGSVWAQFVVEKVTSTSGLVAGEKYIIACGDYGVVMGAIGSTEKYYDPLDATITSTLITAIPSDVTLLTLGGSTDVWTFQSNISGNYLSLTGYSNELKAAATATANTEKWTISFSSGNATIKNVAYPKKGKSDNTVRRIEYNKSSGQERFACYASTQEAVQLYHVTNYQASISSVGWSTFSCPSALNFTSVSTANAYMVTGASGTTLTLTPVTGTIPANTGLLISGTANASVNIPVVGSSTTVTTSNKLKAGTGASINAADKYVMVARGGKAVFAPTGTNAATVAVGKAYLDLNGVVLAPGFVLDDSETTGIKAIENSPMSIGNFYDLQGRKIVQPTKGLYIVNGKKVIIK